VIAVGDVPLEITLRVTLRGRVRDLAVFLDALTSCEAVVFLAKEHRDDNEHEAVSDSREEFGCNPGGRA
jgi:hypothetical protein